MGKDRRQAGHPGQRPKADWTTSSKPGHSWSPWQGDETVHRKQSLSCSDHAGARAQGPTNTCQQAAVTVDRAGRAVPRSVGGDRDQDSIPEPRTCPSGLPRDRPGDAPYIVGQVTKCRSWEGASLVTSEPQNLREERSRGASSGTEKGVDGRRAEGPVTRRQWLRVCRGHLGTEGPREDGGQPCWPGSPEKSLVSLGRLAVVNRECSGMHSTPTALVLPGAGTQQLEPVV